MADLQIPARGPAALQSLPPTLESAVRAELQTGEEITWLDQPVARGFFATFVMLTAGGLVLAGLGIVQAFRQAWGAGPAVTDPGTPGWLPMAMWALMVVAGLAIAASPLLIRRSTRRTVYVLTDRRAILVQGMLWGLRVRSFEPAILSRMERMNRRNGVGDLIFARDVQSDGNGGTQLVPVGFLSVRNVDAVEARVRELAAPGAPGARG